MSDMAMSSVLRRINIKNATVHGFRSSFRDWVGDATEYSREIAEMSLTHVVGSACASGELHLTRITFNLAATPTAL